MICAFAVMRDYMMKSSDLTFLGESKKGKYFMSTSAIFLYQSSFLYEISIDDASRKSLPRPPKPKSRDAIINWFRTEELPRGTGLDPITRQPAVWFHG